MIEKSGPSHLCGVMNHCIIDLTSINILGDYSMNSTQGFGASFMIK